MARAEESYRRAAVVAAGTALALMSLSASGQHSGAMETPPGSASARQATTAAVAFLSGLSESQRTAATYSFTEANRTNWSNVPMFVHARPGLRIGDLTDDQRQAVHRLLRASMSSQGYQKVAGIIRLDSIHGAMELEALASDGPGTVRICARRIRKRRVT